MPLTDHFLRPDWPAPPCVHACVTTRQGGVSTGPWASFNLALHVNDKESLVQENRRLLHLSLQSIAPCDEPQWLTQVHGTKVVDAAADPLHRRVAPEADAVYTRQKGVPCAVLTADCLPVFFCDKEGKEVAVAHAGWRGLAGGVLEATVARFSGPAQALMAWMGPAIGATAFEVGAEVREQFLLQHAADGDAFRPSPHSEKFLADLYQLAFARLKRLGLMHVSGGGFCTVTDSERFYSYRRETQTGRMASLIWIGRDDAPSAS